MYTTHIMIGVTCSQICYLKHAIVPHLEHVLIVSPEPDVPAARLLVDETVTPIMVMQETVVMFATGRGM